MSSYTNIQQVKLTLPSFSYKCKEINDQTFIWDSLRSKYLVLTPEEWVRQHLVQTLISNYRYPKGLLSIEKEIILNKQKKRYDVVVHNKLGHPLLLVECKSYLVALNQQVIEQVLRYNIILSVARCIISNGMETYYFYLENNQWKINAHIPYYEEMV